jgi:hypothetical protein
MSNSVMVREGQTLNVVIGTASAGEIVAHISYETLLKHLKLKSRTRSTRRSKSEETLAARRINLYYRALKTGKWSNGSSVTEISCIEGLRRVLAKVTETNLSEDMQTKLNIIRSMGYSL